MDSGASSTTYVAQYDKNKIMRGNYMTKIFL